MGTRLIACVLTAGVLLAAPPAARAATSPYAPGPGNYPRFAAKEERAGLSYGQAAGFTLPRTILFSVSPDELLADGRQWRDCGIGAFFVTGVPGDWSADIWSVDGEPWTIGASDETFQAMCRAAELCRELGCELFPTMSFGRFFDWFDDLAWPRIEDQFRQFGLFARASGCTGVAIDIEYVYPQYHFAWDGYTYAGYDRTALVETIRGRMTGVARALYDAFPEAVLLTFPEQGLSLGGLVHAAWIEEAARRDAPGGIHLCTEYTYRRPNIDYIFGHAWLCNHVMAMRLSADARRYWQGHCSLSAGLWPLGEDPDDYHGAEPSASEFRQAFAASLMISRRYNWIYSHNLRDAMLGKPGAAYADRSRLEGFRRTLAARAAVTDERYVRTAGELRALRLRDYSQELGLTLVPTLVAPKEEVEVGLMPAAVYEAAPIARLRPRLWDLGLRIARGEAIDLHRELGTQTRWLIAGPFPNAGGAGLAEAYGPESDCGRGALYAGVSGQVGWEVFAGGPGEMAVNLGGLFSPADEVCAYALCYAHSDAERQVEIRVGANDAWRLWVGGELLREDARPGRMILDREIVPALLPAGVTPILLKVCNDKKDWGFVLRVTDAAGEPVPGVALDAE